MKAAHLVTFLMASIWGLRAVTGNPVTDDLKSVAMVELVDGQCTAFSPEPHLWVTKSHCARSGYKFKIRGEVAEFVKEDKDQDLLLLHGPVVPSIRIAKREVEIGDSLVLFGWPMAWGEEHPPFISHGYMSTLGLWTSLTPGLKKRVRMNVVDGVSYFGMSGGPVTNKRGDVVGVIDSLSITPPIPIAYITPLSELREFLGLK
jgi:hypothetical protein